MPWKPEAPRGAVPMGCPRCGAPCLRQLVGHRAALKVVADAEPIPLAQALALVNPNRLAWCLVELRGGGRELRWKCRTECGHGPVIEHRCPADTPQVLGALW